MCKEKERIKCTRCHKNDVWVDVDVDHESVLCDDCWAEEILQDENLGGTGHGDDSYSDADSGL